MRLLLGCDPEVFVMKKRAKKYYHSAHGLNEGTKEKPVRVEKGAVQVDGMALEFNIDPARTEDEWFTNISTVMKQMEASIPKGLVIKAVPVAHFTRKHLKEQPEEAKELGCSPDFNAWRNGAVNPRPNADVDFRTGAGHVHFGWGKDLDVNDERHIEACCILSKTLDCTLGVGCALFDDGVKRRELYGAPGAFRPKPYGCEYRVASNAWLRDEATIRWVFKICSQVFRKLHTGEIHMHYVEGQDFDRLLMKGTLSPAERKKIKDYLKYGFGLPLPPNVG